MGVVSKAKRVVGINTTAVNNRRKLRKKLRKFCAKNNHAGINASCIASAKRNGGKSTKAAAKMVARGRFFGVEVGV